MGHDAHIMTNIGKTFCQEVTDFIMSNERVAPCGTGNCKGLFNCEACTTNTAGRQMGQ